MNTARPSRYPAKRIRFCRLNCCILMSSYKSAYKLSCLELSYNYVQQTGEITVLTTRQAGRWGTRPTVPDTDTYSSVRRSRLAVGPNPASYPMGNRGFGPGSVVGIATGYVLEGPGIESRWGWDFPHLSRPAPGPLQPPVQWVPGFFRG